MADTLLITSQRAVLLSDWRAEAGLENRRVESVHPESRALYWEALRLKAMTVGARVALDHALSQLKYDHV